VIEKSCDVAIVGAGPAGIAAAISAAESGAQVVLLDDNPRPGGQIWRCGVRGSQHAEAALWLGRLSNSRATLLHGFRVFHADSGLAQAESDGSMCHLRFRRLILATGARELFLPFPGWTLPNVVGAGGLQALVKSGLPIQGKRVVVAGTGPLLLAVAAYLREQGARIECICEQASLRRLGAFALAMTAFPGKLWEAARLKSLSEKASYLASAWPVAAIGPNQLRAVRISQNGRIREVACDYLACGFHLVPNLELARSLHCRVTEGFVEANQLQETSSSGVYCAGEPTGIGGVELSLLEGQIAGYAAAGHEEKAKELFGSRARYKKLVSAIAKAFRLRPELANLAQSDTLLCRCEDVLVERVRTYNSWRAAKLHSRCGMGPCQGRVCGAAAEFLFGWSVESFRPPVFPVACASLASISTFKEQGQLNGGLQ
jgi:NADPH-dependent 2,4-dienoyl-CoA reductase/sulfur reductase-like enzyme